MTFSYQKFVLCTDSVAAFDIDTRFVCDDKSGHQRSLLFFTDCAAESAGSFVDVHQISDIMSGTVVKVDATSPCRYSGQNIQVVSGSSFKEHGMCKIEVTL